MKKNLFELTIVTVLVLAFIRILKSWNPTFLQGYMQLTTALALIYIPVFLNWKYKRSLVIFDHSLRDFLKSCLSFVISGAVIFPLFSIAAYFWQRYVFGNVEFRFAGFPDFFSVAGYYLLLIAFPEELFFRGYFQTTLYTVFSKRWSLIITSLVFAFAHSIIELKWWHFSIFFPSLVFGYLREKNNSITASILFHAASNLLMVWIGRCY